MKTILITTTLSVVLAYGAPGRSAPLYSDIDMDGVDDLSEIEVSEMPLASEIDADGFEGVILSGDQQSAEFTESDVPVWWNGSSSTIRIFRSQQSDCVDGGISTGGLFGAVGYPSSTTMIARNLKLQPKSGEANVEGLLEFSFKHLGGGAECDANYPVRVEVLADGDVIFDATFLTGTADWERHSAVFAVPLFSAENHPSSGEFDARLKFRVHAVQDIGGDFIPAYIDDFGFRFFHAVDTDLDGKPDYDDTDADNDGVFDGVEIGNGTSSVKPDSDDDGTCDGWMDVDEICLGDPELLPPDEDDTSEDDMDIGADDSDDDDIDTDGSTDDSSDDGLADDDDIDDVIGVDDSGDGDNDTGDDTNPPAPVVDTDGDGIPDHLEDANLDGEVGEDETDPENADTDADGLCDGSRTVLGICTGGEDLNNDGDLGTDPGESSPLNPDEPGAPDEPSCSSTMTQRGFAWSGTIAVSLLVGLIRRRRQIGGRQ